MPTSATVPSPGENSQDLRLQLCISGEGDELRRKRLLKGMPLKIGCLPRLRQQYMCCCGRKRIVKDYPCSPAGACRYNAEFPAHPAGPTVTAAGKAWTRPSGLLKTMTISVSAGTAPERRVRVNPLDLKSRGPGVSLGIAFPGLLGKSPSVQYLNRHKAKRPLPA